MANQFIACVATLVPLTAAITYYDVRYRRIPNPLALASLLSGLVLNTSLGGLNGAVESLKGGAFAFGLMLLLHIFSAMGAGDVKLFGSIGAILGAALVLEAFVVVVVTGGVLALISAIRTRTLRETLRRVWLILFSLLSGWQPPKFAAPSDQRQTIPYGVAITLGSLLTVIIYRQ